MRPVDDETAVRAAAQAAIAGAQGFEPLGTFRYDLTVRLDDFEAFRQPLIDLATKVAAQG
jgi:hypothetical protein